MTRIARVAQLAFVALVCSAQRCEHATGPVAPEEPAPASRTYRLGFSAIPPRLTTEAVIQTVNMWMPRSDAALMSLGVPWQKMLEQGISANTILRQEQLELVKAYRANGMAQITVMVDATNGLDRASEADELVAMHRSIKEPAVQAAYREYLMAIDSVLHPTYLALAMETNLTRLAAPRDVYDALVVMTNATAGALRAAGTTAKLSVSVQVDVAWGRLPLTNQFAGIATDLHDFPFTEALGLSAYPYLAGYAQPEDVPIDYYARLAPNATMPLLVMEGGWTSGVVDGAAPSTPAKQARWITRQMQLADRAKLAALFQLTFTDIDLSLFPGPANLALFVQLGLVDTELRPKPALAEWDAAFHRLYARD